MGIRVGDNLGGDTRINMNPGPVIFEGSPAGSGVSTSNFDPKSVDAYDENNERTSIVSFKKNDMLLVLWKNPDLVPDTLNNRSLVLFWGFRDTGLDCMTLSGYVDQYAWSNISLIEKGNSKVIFSFVRNLHEKKVEAEKANEKMRRNIDALKA